MPKPKQFVSISWDWKGQPEAEDMKELEKLGLYVCEDPVCYWSDQCGYLISKKPLTREDLKKYLMKEVGFSEEEAEDQLKNR